MSSRNHCTFWSLYATFLRLDPATADLEERVRERGDVPAERLRLPDDLLHERRREPRRGARVDIQPLRREERLLEVGHRPRVRVLRGRVRAASQHLPARGRDREPALAAPLVARRRRGACVRVCVCTSGLGGDEGVDAGDAAAGGGRGVGGAAVLDGVVELHGRIAAGRLLQGVRDGNVLLRLDVRIVALVSFW